MTRADTTASEAEKHTGGAGGGGVNDSIDLEISPLPLYVLMALDSLNLQDIKAGTVAPLAKHGSLHLIRPLLALTFILTTVFVFRQLRFAGWRK